MADTIFDFVASSLEEVTRLDKLEARGTLRIALRRAGLDARSVTPEQMIVALQRTLPRELLARAIDQVDSVCEALIGRVKGFIPDTEQPSPPESPEEIFRRLASR